MSLYWVCISPVDGRGDFVMHEGLSDFITRNRDKFADKHNNMFAFSFGEIRRYYEFLEVISSRWARIEAEYVSGVRYMMEIGKNSPGTHLMTADEWALHEKSRKQSTTLHLEMESYYLFSKIMLDKVARSLEFFFGSTRGLPLDSHDDLTKNLAKISEQKELLLTKELLGLIPSLKKTISDFRDQQIAHQKSPRVTRGTLFAANGSTKMMLSMLYPKESDVQAESVGLLDLKTLIDLYLDEVVRVLKTNFAKTKLNVLT